MKLKDVALAVKELQTWKAGVDDSIRVLSLQVGNLQKQSDEFGRALAHIHGMSTDASVVVAEPVAEPPSDEPPAAAPTPNAPFGYAFSDAGKAEPAAPILTAAGEAEVAEVARVPKHVMAAATAAQLADSLQVGISDVREIEAATVMCIGKELYLPLMDLAKLSRHPDVDAITKHALSVFVDKTRSMLGLGGGA